MSRTRSQFFAALTGGLVVAVVMAVLPAIAAEGDPMVLGEKNLSATVTRLNTRGGLRIDNFKVGNPALILNVADPASAPFQVNATGMVDNLNADMVDGQDAAAFSLDGHNHDGDYLSTDGTAADSNLLDGLDSTAFSPDGHDHVGYAASAHTHGWADIVSGIPAGLADGDDDALGGLSCDPGQIAKRNPGGTAWECGDDIDTDTDTTLSDGEVFTAVTGQDGTGTGLDADLLDGQEASAFAASSHVHQWADLTIDWDVMYSNLLAIDGTAADSELLDGFDSTAFSLDGHGHDLADLGDTTLTDFGVGELLRWTGSAWANVTLAEAGIAAAGHDHDTDYLATDGTATDSELLDGMDSTAFYRAAPADSIGLPLLGAECLHSGGSVLGISPAGNPVCGTPGGTGVLTDSGQALAGHGGRDVALGDLDGDGDLDLVGAFDGSSGESARIWLNDGTGVFSGTGQVLTPDHPGMDEARHVALGDLDGDGDLDIFLSVWSLFGPPFGANQVWLNDGSGFFADSGQRFGFEATSDVALGDLDGDGDLDSVAVDLGSLTLRFNNGSGVLTSTGSALSTPSAIAASLGDLDGDGDLDILAAVFGGPHWVWLNDGSGGFTDSGQRLDGASAVRGLALGDLDGDNDLDAYVVHESGSGPGIGNRVWVNDGTGAFADSGQSLGTGHSRSVAFGDLDGDSDLDAVVTNAIDGDRIWVNDGSGTFTDSGQTIGLLDDRGIAVGDVDADGDLDVVIAYGTASGGVWFNTDQSYLPTTGTAADSDLLDGLDSTAFATPAAVCPPGTSLAGYNRTGPVCSSSIGSTTIDDQSDTVGAWASLVLDGSGNPVIAYTNTTDDDVLVLRCNDPACATSTIRTITSGGEIFRYASLALDADGYPVVAYQKYNPGTATNSLEVVHCDDSTCSSKSTSTVESSGAVGASPSIVLDAAGFPVIAYQDKANTAINVAHCDDADCTSAVINSVDTGSAHFSYPSLVLDASGYPVVAYIDGSLQAAKLAHCSDADCTGATVNTVDTDTNSSRVSMVLDANGYPVVAYYEGVSTGKLHVAHCSDANCAASTINALEFIGAFPNTISLLLDGSGFPVIAYYLQPDLRLARCADANCASWSAITIDGPDSVGKSCSMVLDASGRPIIAYYDETNGDLKLAGDFR